MPLSPTERYERRKSVERAETVARVMAEPAATPAATVELPLPIPTRAIPGSPEKIAVIERRRELGQKLWHPDDCPGDTDGFLALLSSLTSNGGNRTHRSNSGE